MLPALNDGWLTAVGVLECGEGKEFVSAIDELGYAHRSTERASVLVLVQSILRRGEKIIGIEIVVAYELEG